MRVSKGADFKQNPRRSSGIIQGWAAQPQGGSFTLYSVYAHPTEMYKELAQDEGWAM